MKRVDANIKAITTIIKKWVDAIHRRDIRVNLSKVYG